MGASDENLLKETLHSYLLYLFSQRIWVWFTLIHYFTFRLWKTVIFWLGKWPLATIAVAEWSKTRVFCRLYAGIVGSNLAEGLDVCVL
jgi:hypothetical protein